MGNERKKCDGTTHHNRLVYCLKITPCADTNRRYFLFFPLPLWPWKLHWTIRVIWFDLGAEQGFFWCVYVHVHFSFVACMAVVMDDEKELINTKSPSVWLHPNFPQHVCTVSQQPQTEKQKCNDKVRGKFRGVNKWSRTVGRSWHMRINVWSYAA